MTLTGTQVAEYRADAAYAIAHSDTSAGLVHAQRVLDLLDEIQALRHERDDARRSQRETLRDRDLILDAKMKNDLTLDGVRRWSEHHRASDSTGEHATLATDLRERLRTGDWTDIT